MFHVFTHQPVVLLTKLFGRMCGLDMAACEKRQSVDVSLWSWCKHRSSLEGNVWRRQAAVQWRFLTWKSKFYFFDFL